MNIAHITRTPDGYNWEVWFNGRLVDTFSSRWTAEDFCDKNGWIYETLS